MLSSDNWKRSCSQSLEATCCSSKSRAQAIQEISGVHCQQVHNKIIKETARGGALPDLILTDEEGLVRGVNIPDSLWIWGGRRAQNKISILEFRREVFTLQALLGRIPWEMALKGKGVWESWLLYRNYLLQAQEWSILMSRKSSKGGRSPAWIRKELLIKLRQATWEESRDTSRVCKDEVKKTKAHLEFNLVRDVKGNKKGFYRCISSKIKAMENAGPLLKNQGKLILKKMMKSKDCHWRTMRSENI